MTKLGDIRVSDNGKNKWIWAACSVCSKERWAVILRGAPKADKCLPCGLAARKERVVATYSGVHRRLNLKRGKASGYTCRCGSQAHEWAYLGGDPDELHERGLTFSTDLDRYEPMCRRCHRVMDKAYISHCPHGHEYAGDNLIFDGGNRKCRTCVYERNRARSVRN